MHLYTKTFQIPCLSVPIRDPCPLKYASFYKCSNQRHCTMEPALFWGHEATFALSMVAMVGAVLAALIKLVSDNGCICACRYPNGVVALETNCQHESDQYGRVKRTMPEQHDNNGMGTPFHSPYAGPATANAGISAPMVSFSAPAILTSTVVPHLSQPPSPEDTGVAKML